MTQQQQQIQEIEEIEEWMGALNKMKTYYKKQSETENKILSVFSCIDTREIIMGFKKEKIQTERIKTEEGIIKKYFDIKLEDEIQRVKTNFARVVKGEYLISSPRDIFQSNFKRHLKEHIASEFRQYGKNKTIEYILKNNEDAIRRQTYETVKKFTVACEKYFEVMEGRSSKKNAGEQFIKEHEGVTYKLFNKAGKKIRNEINNKFLELYIEEDVNIDSMERKLTRDVKKYENRYK